MLHSPELPKAQLNLHVPLKDSLYSKCLFYFFTCGNKYMVDNENSCGAKHPNWQFFTHFSRKLTGFSRTSHGFFTHVSNTCFYHDCWRTDITPRIQRPTKVESAGLTGTLPKFKLNLHVEDQGSYTFITWQSLTSNGLLLKPKLLYIIAI